MLFLLFSLLFHPLKVIFFIDPLSPHLEIKLYFSQIFNFIILNLIDKIQSKDKYYTHKYHLIKKLIEVKLNHKCNYPNFSLNSLMNSIKKMNQIKI